MSNNGDADKLAESKIQHEKYPLNLVRAEDFSYVLQKYHTTLQNGELRFFCKQNLIVIWDLKSAEDKKHVETKFRDTEGLEKTLAGLPADPRRRFIFLQSPSSRDPLACNRQQLTLLLTHHQVMPSFLDFVFTFRGREKPHSFTSFRYENYLGSNHRQAGLQGMGRSGIRIQHSFNILGIEADPKNEGKWLQRQVGAYHSFDPVQGRSTWIVMKGDAIMRKRFQSVTEESLNKGRSLKTVQDFFAQSLEDHLLILQWGVENWASYTESFETDYRHFSSITEHAPVKELVEDIPINRMIQREQTLKFEKDSRQQTNTSQTPTPTPAPGIMRRVTKRMTDLSSMSHVPGIKQRILRPYSWNSKTLSSPKMPYFKLEELASIDQLQGLSLLDKNIDEAISVIDQNRRVLGEIKNHYRDLVKSSAFRKHFTNRDALDACEESVQDFVQKIARLEGDLENYQGNLRTLLRGLQKMGVLFNCILQYQNMRTTEDFAKSSEEATDVMQVWTEQMHEKTMSMHVITVFTLIFLPGTFVATIFSSGILTFGNDGESGGSKLGDWKVRGAGLKLFLAICLPLMTLTICVWLIAYTLARLRRGSRAIAAWSGGKGTQADKIPKEIV